MRAHRSAAAFILDRSPRQQTEADFVLSVMSVAHPRCRRRCCRTTSRSHLQDRKTDGQTDSGVMTSDSLQRLLADVPLPSRTMELIPPYSGTSSGFPCSSAPSPALSRSWTKPSEYCCSLETLKTTLNVASTSPLASLGGRETGGAVCCSVKQVTLRLAFTHPKATMLQST